MENRIRYDLYLSYSGRKCYLTCPMQYKYHYILKDPSRRDPKGSFFGSAIGKIFELFYKDNLWSKPDPVTECEDLIEPVLKQIFDKENWNPISDFGFVSSLRKDLKTFIPSSIDIIKKNHFLTPTSRAEVDLTVLMNSKVHNLTLKIGGRADFIHGTGSDIWIIDGKGSAHKDKYVDPEQVIWYATQHFIKYHVSPARIGFLYYRFPDDPVQWVSYDDQAVRSNLKLTFDTAKNILENKFDVTPSKECKFCDYSYKCSDGSKYISDHKVSSNERITTSIFDIETL